MTDVDARVKRLLKRIQAKREEVHRHFDAAFYVKCRAILNAIMKEDVNGIFASNPLELPEYAVRISRPMWWKLISKRLDKYEYADKMEFVRDMRLVTDNCYAYNGDVSPVAALGRRLEVLMEDLFVRELDVAPPNAKEIIRLGKGVSPTHARQLWDIMCRYEDKVQKTAAARQHIVPTQLKCATQRRVIAFLLHLTQLGEQNDRPKKASHASHSSLPPRQPKAQPQQFPTKSILENDADVEFISDQKTEPNAFQEPQFERVPQNQRSGFSSFCPVSPIHFEGSDLGEE